MLCSDNLDAAPSLNVGDKGLLAIRASILVYCMPPVSGTLILGDIELVAPGGSGWARLASCKFSMPGY